MTKLLQAAAIVALLTASLCFIEIAKTANDLSRTLVETDRTLGELSLTAQAAQYRLAQVDPVLVKAGKSLDSLDRAIKTHERATAKASDELHGTFQNANAILLQAGLASDEVRLASIEQRQGLLESNRRLTATLEESRLLLADIRARVNDPAIPQTLAHVNSTAEAVDQALHPKKQTRAQRALRFILETIFGNAVRGAVTR